MDKGGPVHNVLNKDLLSYLCSDILDFCLFNHFALLFIYVFLLYCHLQKKDREGQQRCFGVVSGLFVYQIYMVFVVVCVPPPKERQAVQQRWAWGSREGGRSRHRAWNTEKETARYFLKKKVVEMLPTLKNASCS